MTHKLAWTLATLLLATGCWRSSRPETKPIIKLVDRPPCLTSPPVEGGPILLAVPRCEGAAESAECALTPAQVNALWAAAEAWHDYAVDAYESCGPRSERRGGPAARDGGTGAGEAP